MKNLYIKMGKNNSTTIYAWITFMRKQMKDNCDGKCFSGCSNFSVPLILLALENLSLNDEDFFLLDLLIWNEIF